MEKVIRTLLQRDISNITLFADSKGTESDPYTQEQLLSKVYKICRSCLIQVELLDRIVFLGIHTCCSASIAFCFGDIARKVDVLFIAGCR